MKRRFDNLIQEDSDNFLFSKIVFKPYLKNIPENFKILFSIPHKKCDCCK